MPFSTSLYLGFISRVKSMLLSSYSNYKHEAGCDEAGRGCLAGPVVAAAVVFASDYKNEAIRDSKSLSEKERFRLRPIIEQDALTYAIAFADEKKIDEINILQASIHAMHCALNQLSVAVDFIIVDGNRFIPFENIAHKTIVKGDSKYLSIAAAGILAKTWRDEYMLKLHDQYPEYGWCKNKGYPTKDHRKAIEQYGSCLHHRMSFRLLAKT